MQIPNAAHPSMKHPAIIHLFKTSLVLMFMIGMGSESAAQSPPPYSFGFVPASITEFDIGFPLYEKWHLSGQADLQLVTQGTYTNKNPFAYVQRAVVRPWIIYSGFRKMKLSIGYAHNQKYAIDEAGNYETLERRLIVMGTYSHDLPKGSLFEQVRFETKFFDDRSGVHQVVPRLRARFGVNHFLNQHKVKPLFYAPNISYYTELMLKFAKKDYAEEHFDIFRMSVYYSAGISQKLHFMGGIIGQMQLRTNGTQFDIYYGPMVSFRYSIKPKQRETFETLDGGAD